MPPAEIARLMEWLTEQGLAGMSEAELLGACCRRLVAAGVPVARAMVLIDTLHPIYEGRAFRWRGDTPDETRVSEYGSTREGEAAGRWQRSPFALMLDTGRTTLRLDPRDPAAQGFTMIDELRADGMIDHLALIHRFAADGVIGEMDCIYSSWTTDAPGGFAEADLAALQRVSATLGLAAKSASLARIAATLVETYLGRDAGRRVLHGVIARGVAEEIDAVIWFSDLRSFTRISDASVPAAIIPLLNDYAEAIIPAIEAEGGDVLKLIGDGILAIFKADSAEQACAGALAATARAREQVSALNVRRAAEGLPATEFYLGLHSGKMFYGNIGSVSRLDFTVVGPAVNEASRIAAMCRSVDQPLLLSSAFVEAAGAAARPRFVSVGRFALRGVGGAQHLFTLDPAMG